jgi:uncharacterized protein (DUF885 family)
MRIGPGTAAPEKVKKLRDIRGRRSHLALNYKPNAHARQNPPLRSATLGRLMREWSFAAALALLVVSCRAPARTSDTGFDTIARDLIYGVLALSPVYATSTGYHRHDGVSLDEQLDDYSPMGLDAQKRFYESFERRMATINPAALDPEQRADLEIVRRNVSLALLELTTLQSYKHNPTVYVELAGNALFSPYVLNYASKDQRFGHIIKRLEKIPAFFEQAKANLIDAPEVWNRVAREENDGNLQLVDQTLREEVPDAERADYARAAGPALAALRGFNTFLETSLSQRPSDWRLGRDKYASKCEYVLGTGKTPGQLLADAEADLQATRAEMERLAAPVTVKQALDEIARHHATPDTYLAEVRQILDEATAFVREKGLVSLPGRGNLQMIETPEFLRGIYAVGGFNAAPALEPRLGAFFWITPIPKTWPPERVESKLREYNDYGLRELTIHEAMPGHYVQFEYANDIQPDTRRLLRNIFGSGSYVEGWGFYVQQMMSDEGYLNGSKALRLTFLKQALRVLANTILDVRLQTMGMTDKQALDLMMNEAYQEREEATAKLQRAQLSSCQLPTYYAGWKGWLAVRDGYKARRGSSFSLREFHERALKEGAVALPLLHGLLQ